MSSITVDFEFEIGDIVYFKDHDHDATRIPYKYVVFERIAQECHGGVQRLYRLCGHGVDMVTMWPAVVLTKDKPAFEPRDHGYFEHIYKSKFSDGPPWWDGVQKHRAEHDTEKS